MLALIGYRLGSRKVSTRTLKVLNTLLWQGCRVGESQGALTSKEAKGPKRVLASMPDRKEPMLMLPSKWPLEASKKAGELRKQRICGAWEVQASQERPREEASCEPVTKDRYCDWVVKKEVPETSSQRSKVVEFLFSVPGLLVTLHL